MIEINLIPHEGITIRNTGKVCFGQTTEEVEKILGTPTTKHLSYRDKSLNLLFFYNPTYVGHLPSDTILAANMRYYYDGYEIRIDFDANQRVEFFECISGPFPNRTRPFIYENEAFTLLACELIELLSIKNNGNVEIENPKESKKSYSYLEIDVSIWRETNENDMKIEIEEGKAAGMYEINKESYEHDLKKSCHFWTIGIGYKGYCKEAHKH